MDRDQATETESRPAEDGRVQVVTLFGYEIRTRLRPVPLSQEPIAETETIASVVLTKPGGVV